MGALGWVLFWACGVIAALAGGMAFGVAVLAGEIELAIYVLMGVVALGLVLYWLFWVFR